jgi:SPP1 gp7 family putative phage head morphogenesis protein
MQLYDFLSKDEEDAIRAIEEALLRKTAESRKRAVEKLAKLLTVSYYIGAERALKEVGADVRITSLEIRALEKLIEQDVAPAIKEMYEFLERDIKSVIEEGIREGLTYDEISARLKERLRTTFGEEIHFDRRGKLREEIYIDRRGRLRVRQVKITRTKTLKLDDYADLLARTNVKKAYALGHREGYVAAGLRKWRYRSVADERTRPHHLALHGRVFEVGTAEEELALRVMSEPNCRCRPSPYFDDPKLDTPQEVFEQEKKKWAQEWQREKGLDSLGKYLEPFDRKGLAPPSYDEQLNYLIERFKKSEDMRTLLSITGESPQAKAKEILGISLRHSTFHGTASSYRHMVQDGRRYSLSDVFSIKKSPEWVRRDPDTGEFLLHGKSKIYQRPVYIILTPDRKIKTSFVITKRKEVEKLKMRFKEELK